MKKYQALNVFEILLLGKTGIDLEDVLLSERSQAQEDKRNQANVTYVTYMWNIKRMVLDKLKIESGL